MKHLLFKKKKKESGMTYAGMTFSIGSIFGEQKESWQEEKAVEATIETVAAKNEFILEFVSICESPKEVARRVRKEPLENFVLFSGDMHEIKTAIPVFIGGKAAETMDKEWA